jgi:thioredoxin 1
MKEVIVSFLIALVAGAFINGFAVSGTATAPAAAGAVEPTMGAPDSPMPSLMEVTDATFDSEVLQSSTPVLVDFYTPTCAPCREMAPIIEQVAEDFDGRVKVVRMDIDSNPRVAMQYSVNTLPTFMIFKEGKRGEAFTGKVPKGILAQSLTKVTE